ncbi:hypothetical protein SESBI_37597 [Sesbania bispinosa]|nr:hypothetical protein SESBI_37597 [Sesbania bispinosa]
MITKMMATKTTQPNSDSSSLMGSPSLEEHRPSNAFVPSPSTKQTQPESAPSRPTRLFSSNRLKSGMVKTRTVLLERTTNMNSLKNCGWDIYPYTDRQDLGSYFERDGYIYPRMVRAFYATAEETIGDGSTVTKSLLKGVDMKLTLRLICLIIV